MPFFIVPDRLFFILNHTKDEMMQICVKILNILWSGMFDAFHSPPLTKYKKEIMLSVS